MPKLSEGVDSGLSKRFFIFVQIIGIKVEKDHVFLSAKAAR